MTLFQRVKDAISILANVVVIPGIVFAVLQITQSERLDRRRIAVEAMIHLRSEAFLDALLRMKTTYRASRFDDAVLYRDTSYVLGWYDHVAILYLSGLVDRCLVKHTIFHSASEVAEVLGSLKQPFPPELRRNFDLILNRMTSDPCS